MAPSTKPSRGEKYRARPPISTREALRQRGPSRRALSQHQRAVRRRRIILFGGSALVSVIIAILGFGYLRDNVWRAQETVAVIFGERVTAGDLLERTRPQVSGLDRRVAAMRASAMTQQATQLQLQRQRLPETVLNDLVEDRVVRREAATRGIVVTSEEVDARIRQEVAQSDAANDPQPTPTVAPTIPAEASPTVTPAGTPTPRPTATPVPTLTEDRFGPALQLTLSAAGLDADQLRRLVESGLYEEKLRSAVGEQVASVQEQVRARHIVFGTEDETNAGLQQLNAGTSFEELAASQSRDSATKDKGGDLGWLPRAGRDPSFDEALFSLQPDQTSSVVRTAAGWEIIQVLERDPARPIDDRLLEEMRRRYYGDWLAAAMGSPEIDRQLDPDESSWILQRATSRRA